MVNRRPDFAAVEAQHHELLARPARERSAQQPRATEFISRMTVWGGCDGYTAAFWFVIGSTLGRELRYTWLFGSKAQCTTIEVAGRL